LAVNPNDFVSVERPIEIGEARATFGDSGQHAIAPFLAIRIPRGAILLLANDLNVGDVVRLKSGGSAMTSSKSMALIRGNAFAFWFDKEDRRQTGVFFTRGSCTSGASMNHHGLLTSLRSSPSRSKRLSGAMRPPIPNISMAQKRWGRVAAGVAVFLTMMGFILVGMA
jgi:uncharacterized protein YodC (DUF2158 family)